MLYTVTDGKNAELAVTCCIPEKKYKDYLGNNSVIFVICVMAKSYMISFDPEVVELLEGFAHDDRTTGRQWIIQSVLDRIKLRENAVKALQPTTYVFKMKDGRMLKETAKNPGTAWAMLGYKFEQMETHLIAWKTEADAEEAGWLAAPESAMEVTPAPTATAPEQNNGGGEVDLPFGS